MKSICERFWEKVDVLVDDQCWEWIASRFPSGYGQFQMDGRPHRANRVAFWLVHGHWPIVCRHECDNPGCVNPKHLLDGSHKDNRNDAVVRNRARFSLPGEGNWNCKLSDEQVRSLRSLRGAVSERRAAMIFGVSRAQIGRIWRGERRSNILGAA
ncbi:UNVERIFIED_ORG: hypothetical protein ABIC48_003864 [Burkholderia territorii]